LSPEPIRTCVGCRIPAPKPALVRVQLREGEPVLMPAGIVAGRGAYLHADPACVDAALKRGALQRALRSGLSAEGIARLRAEMDGMSNRRVP
jgi:hypothetical protein